MLNSVVSDNLQILFESIILIEERFSKVDVPDKFVTSSEGVILLDAVAKKPLNNFEFSVIIKSNNNFF